MDELWVRYPWKGEQVIVRGCVFSLWTRVAAHDADVDAWTRAEPTDPDAPPRPAWTSVFTPLPR